MKLKDEQYFELSHHEDELINHRLTWLIGSQSLLFAGYALLLGVDTSSPAFPIERWNLAVQWFPWLGIFISSLIFLGILSAIIASTILKIRFDREDFGVHVLTTLGGWSTALLFPVAFAVVWAKIGL